MTWTRVSDDALDKPVMLALSRSTRYLHLEALVYCNRHLSNGLLPRGALPRITDHENPPQGAAELVEVGLWVEVATGWLLDWDDQLTSQQVEDRRKATKARVDAYRERGELHRAGDHSQCTKTCPHVSNGVTNGVTNAVGNSAPLPSRPDPQRGTRDNGRSGRSLASGSRPSLVTRGTAGECPTHIGQLAESCRGCRADALVGEDLSSIEEDGDEWERIDGGPWECVACGHVKPEHNDNCQTPSRHAQASSW